MYAQCCTLRQPCLLFMKKILPHHIVYIYLLLGCLQFSSYASGQSCKIFESTNAATGWNGKTGSILQPPGIYVWQAIVQFAGESRRLFKGTTALVP